MAAAGVVGRTASALKAQTTRLRKHIQKHPDLHLPDLAYTLQIGRRAFAHRRMLVCHSVEGALTGLERSEEQATARISDTETPGVVFLFPGEGTEYVDMGLELYRSEILFRGEIDRCASFLAPKLGLDLRSVLYPEVDERHEANRSLEQVSINQPVLFTVEYALARMWIALGIAPRFMIGHGLGEYVAACLSDVFSLEDALTLVATRAQLIQSLTPGPKLAEALSETKLRPMKSIALSFLEGVKKIDLHPPRIPYFSNVTGTWIDAAEATDPEYWVNHLLQPIPFAENMESLDCKQSIFRTSGVNSSINSPAFFENPMVFSISQDANLILLEVGPGHTLGTLARRHPGNFREQIVLYSLPSRVESSPVGAVHLHTLGRLWLAGLSIDWSGMYRHVRRRRLSLPTYPFERRRYWIEPDKIDAESDPGKAAYPDWQAIVEAGRIQEQIGIEAFNNSVYREKKQGLHHLCAGYINLALRELGAFNTPSDHYSVDDLLRRFSILPRYRQLIPRCLNALVAQGYLEQHENTFTNLKALERNDWDGLVSRVKGLWADAPQWIELVRVCGERYAAVLTGEVDPRALLFTGPTYETLQEVYQNSAESNYFNRILQAVLKQIVQALPTNVHLKILEIGAGTGATTAHLLPELPRRRTSYTFTDIGPAFLTQAREKFAEYNYVDYRVLDIQNPPGEQGFGLKAFDIIIAANILHATRNLSEALAHTHSLLAPNGFLLLWEITQPEVLFFDIAFPLMEPFDEADPLRSQHPFLTPLQWQDALRSAGFVDAESFPETDPLEDHILIARADGTADNVVQMEHFNEKVKSHYLRYLDSTAHERASHRRPDVSNDYTPPKNDLERTLAKTWQECFGIDQIGIHDDFFELGGDSLLAVQLLTRLGEVLGFSLASHSLLESPSIAKLADKVSRRDRISMASSGPDEQSLSSVLVEIQPGNTKETPLFLIHPAGGHVYLYRDLANCLDSRQTVYGLQAVSNADENGNINSLETMATRYNSALRTVQPEGPYYLGGASLGGLVAFEMAQQLRADGKQIAMLAAIDTPIPTRVQADILRDDADILAYLINADDDLAVSPDRIRQISPDERLQYFVDHGRMAKRLLPDTSLDKLARYLRIFKQNLQAMRRYRPQPYAGPILFFRARDPDAFGPKYPEIDWIDLAVDGVKVVEVPGNHITMNFSPNVAIIANTLRGYLSSN